MNYWFLHSHAPLLQYIHRGKWDLAQGPFSKIGLRFLLSSLFKLRELCQNLRHGEEHNVKGKNKWGKTEALDRGEGGGSKRTSSFHLFQRPEIYSHLSFVAVSPFLTVILPHLFPASSSDSFEITIKRVT